MASRARNLQGLVCVVWIMSQGDRLRFGNIEFDADSGELTTATAFTRLAPQPALVLSTLVRRPGEVVTRSELQAAVWGNGTHVDYEQNLNFCVRQVRKALGDSAEAPRFIETLPKRGYRWIAAETRSATTGRPPLGRRRWAVAVALAAGLVVGVGLEHGIAASPLHQRAVTWAHGLLQVPDGACPFG